MEFDGAGDQACSGVCGAAGGVAQAGADGCHWCGAGGSVTDDPAGDVGEEERQGGGEVTRGEKTPRLTESWTASSAGGKLIRVALRPAIRAARVIRVRKAW